MTEQSIDESINQSTENQAETSVSNSDLSTSAVSKENASAGDAGDKKRTFNKRRTFQKRDKPEQSGKMSVLGIRRVAKVGRTKRLSFSACVVVGDMLGSVGIGMGKGRDVNTAILQASAKARKMQIRVNLRDNTIPHQIEGRFCKSGVIIRNAHKGTGVKAGNVVRAIFTCLGVKDLVSKVIGNRNFLNVAHATMCALEKIKVKQNQVHNFAKDSVAENTVDTNV